MYSLEQDARERYFSLHAASISPLKEFHTCFRKHCKYVFLVEFFFKYCCEQDDFYNTISDSKNHDDKYSQGFKTYHEEVVVSDVVEDEEVTFSNIVVKEEFHDHYDNQVVVLGQVEDYSSDEISRDSLGILS